MRGLGGAGVHDGIEVLQLVQAVPCLYRILRLPQGHLEWVGWAVEVVVDGWIGVMGSRGRLPVAVGCRCRALEREKLY